MLTWLIVLPVLAAVLGAVRLLRRHRIRHAFRWLLATNLALLGGAGVVLATALAAPAQASAQAAAPCARTSPGCCGWTCRTRSRGRGVARGTGRSSGSSGRGGSGRS